MKRIITLTLMIFTSFTLAATKEELIDQYIAANNVEARFHEGINKIFDELKTNPKAPEGDDYIHLTAVMRKHATWESWKPYYVSILSDTYTKEELETWIEFQKTLPPEIKKLIQKDLDMQVRFVFAQDEWQEALWPKIKEDIIAYSQENAQTTNSPNQELEPTSLDAD